MERANEMKTGEIKRKVALACIALAIAVAAGCKTYYENAGLRVRAGSVTAPIELSEPTSSTNLRLLFFLNGVDLYVAKGYGVQLEYAASDGGTWLTSASTQTVWVTVSPTNICDATQTR